MAAREAVRFDRITKVYRQGLWGRRGVTALRGVSLAVPKGSVFGLLGPNRAGKTTLVKILLSVCRATSGTFERLGHPGGHRRTLARVGYLHESQAFPRYLTATELLEFYGRLAFESRVELRKNIPRLLEEVGLADRARDPISTYSKGMVQRLALAQALLNDPDLLVLDEPTEGMDLLARQLLYRLVDQHRRRGKTTIMVSHSLADVERLCDRVAVLRCGEVAFHGPLSQLARSESDQTPASIGDALQTIYEVATP